MTTTLTFHPKFGIRIPAKTLREAGFQPKKTFIINIIPQQYKAEKKKKDWLDEALATEEGEAYFDERIRKVEEERRAGKTRPIEELFKELGSNDVLDYLYIGC